MISKVLWQSWLASPAIVGAALFASSGALAQDATFTAKAAQHIPEAPVATVTDQPSTRELANAAIAANVVSKPEPLTASNPETSVYLAQTAGEDKNTHWLDHKLELLAASNPKISVQLAQTPRDDRNAHLLEQINRYSNENEADSPKPDNSFSQLQNASPKPADANEGVIEQINQYSNDNGSTPLDQVTNVTQLRDVSPGDWAFEALRSLVERYGCIAGYPDGTYRGNRAMTRYEFAAGLNACLQQVERILKTSSEGFATKQDLATIQRLIEEFGSELAVLRGRVDALEARTTELELTQFSTTTKLNAEVVLALAGVPTGNTVNGNRVNGNTVLGDRVRLNFDTSFTGKDLLRTRLQALNLDAFSGSATFTSEGDLRFAGPAFDRGNNNSVGIDALLYQFPIGKKTTVVIEANAGAVDDFTNTVNPYIDGDGGTGALSHFGTRNPIYYLLNGTGLALKHEFSDKFEVSLGYLANDAANPEEKGGLFDGPYGAIAQITLKPIEPLTVGLTYIHAYNNDFTANGSGGSIRSNLRSALLADNPNFNLPAELQPFQGLSLPTSTNAYGVQASFQLSPKFVINGWAGYTTTRTLAALQGTNGQVLERGDYSTWNFAVNLAFPDLGTKGSVAGIIFGMEPKVTGASRSLRNVIGKDRDTSFHVEGFYQFKLSENIAITPGVIWLTAPDHNSNNDDILIGTIRTTFTF
jgi:hypothetical protein